MSRGPFLPRHNRIFIDSFDPRSGEVNWIMDQDIQGNKLPKRLKLIGITTQPSVSTIRALRIYSKETRIRTVTNTEYSLIYEDTWTTSTLANTNHESVIPNKTYVDDDAAKEAGGTIWGTMQIKAGESPSAFVIDIDYIEN